MTEPAYPNETVEISLEALATMLKVLGYKMETIDD